jgi:hypothetical protein
MGAEAVPREKVQVNECNRLISTTIESAWDKLVDQQCSTGSLNYLQRVAQSFRMKPNIWEFLKKPDGTYAVSHNGKILSDSIPEKNLNDELCLRYRTPLR